MHYVLTPYPDEHIASYVARMVRRTRLPAYILSPSRGNPVSARLPRFITEAEALSQLLTGGLYEPRDFVRQFCIYPYFAPFISNLVRMRHLRSIKVFRSQGATLAKSIENSPRRLRLCPVCVEEQSASPLGEPYFLRCHQLPGINVCLTHLVALQETGATFGHYSFLTARMALTQKKLAPKKSVSIPPDLAEFVRNSLQVLFSRDCFRNSRLRWRELYLITAGIRRGKNLRSDTARLVEGLRKRGVLSLADAFSGLEEFAPSLLSFLRSDFPLVPMEHLLLLHHLSIPLQDALEYAVAGLWKCPNPVCPDRDKLTLRPIGKYGPTMRTECRTCEFVVSIAPDTPVGTKPAIGWIFKRGRHLDHELRMLHAGGGTTDDIAAALGLSRNIVYSSLTDLGLFEGSTISAAKRHERIIQKHRQKLLSLLRQNPGASRTFLAETLTPSHRFCQLHDREWLEKHLPPAYPKNSR